MLRDPYGSWCGRSGVVRLRPIPISCIQLTSGVISGRKYIYSTLEMVIFSITISINFISATKCGLKNQNLGFRTLILEAFGYLVGAS